MTPPLNDIISPTVIAINPAPRDFKPLPGTGTLYVEQMEHIGKLAQSTSASRKAHLFAKYSE